MNLVEIKDKLRQLDVLSGFYGVRQKNDLDAICEDLAFNDVAELVAEVERLQVACEEWQHKYAGSWLTPGADPRKLRQEIERLRAVLIDLVTGRTCKALEGSALIVATLALGESVETT